MTHPIDIIEELASNGTSAVMATLVATGGTTPKLVGARMFVGENGGVVGSVTIGGCVDAAVIAAADEIIGDGGRRLLSLELADEEAWDLGLNCGGTVEVLLECLDLSLVPQPGLVHFRVIEEKLAAAVPSVRVVEIDGSGEMLVTGDGHVSVAAGLEFPEECRAVAAELLRDGESVSRAVGAAGKRVFFELHRAPPILLIVGANDVAVALAPMALGQGYRVIVVDPRPRFANEARFPGVRELHAAIPSELVAQVPMTPDTAVALVVHDHKFEVPVLEHVLRSEARYVGLLGGRKRSAGVKALLRERGLLDEEIERIHVPIGLDIGARSAPEIALAILAEILAERTGRAGALRVAGK